MEKFFNIPELQEYLSKRDLEKEKELEKEFPNLDASAYQQGRRDKDRGIFGFNPYHSCSNRARSYDLGNT